MSTEPLLKFFSSKSFAVVGASADPKKFGNKILKWYINHSLPVHPINPTAATIESLNVVKSVAHLETPEVTSLSFLTQPPITLSALKEASRIGVKRVWLQPGSFDGTVMDEVGGMGFETVIAGGRCILVEGEKGLKASKRESKV